MLKIGHRVKVSEATEKQRAPEVKEVTCPLCGQDVAVHRNFVAKSDDGLLVFEYDIAPVHSCEEQTLYLLNHRDAPCIN